MGSAIINIGIEIEEDEAACDKVSEVIGNTMPKILQQIVAERCAQDVQWGGDAHDDDHTAEDWESLLVVHACRLTGNFGVSSPDYRDRLVKIAALAVAAAQAWDRRPE